MPDIAPPELSVEAARKQLGFEEGERLEDGLSKWRKLESRLVWMVESASNPLAKGSYERDLAELRDLMKAATAEVPEEKPAELPVEALPKVLSVQQEIPARQEIPAPEKAGGKGKGRFLTFAVVLGLLGGGGYYAYQQGLLEFDGGEREVVDLETLQSSFEVAIEKRRWDEAEDLIALLEEGGAAKEVVDEALAEIENGRAEEKGQQIAFLISNAQSALEAGLLSEAENFCQEVVKLQPGHPMVPAIRDTIRESKLEVRSSLIVNSIEKAMEAEDWRTAKGQLEMLKQANPEYPRIPFIAATLKTAEEEMIIRKEKAAVLVAKARALDEGTYSAETIVFLEEAVRLDPSEANRELYKRMASYGKVVKVPGDHETISAALKAAKKNDRVFVSKGVYRESLVVPDGVQIVGESRVDTIIECPADVGAVITVPRDARDVRVASLTLRHSGLVNDDERSPAVAVDGGTMEGEDLSVVRASGHGIAVLNGGKATLSLCKVSDSGWDGISVTGEGSSADLIKVTSEKNLHHGVDFWDGASGSVSGSVLVGNGRNGLFAIEPMTAISVKTTRSEKNREVGIYFSGANGVTVADCQIHENFLGGVLFDHGSKAVSIKGNKITKNGEAGLVFEKGVEVLSEEENQVEENTGKQIWRDAVFPTSSGEDTVSPPPPPPPLKEEEN